MQCIFHDEAAIARIYSACSALPVPIVPAITLFFSLHVLFRNYELTGLLPLYQESGVLHTACCTQEQEDKE